MEFLSDNLKFPDPWQREAVRALLDGRDVIVDAPTGSGKTFIFELLIESGFRGQCLFTVPTRALANDKRREWQEAGWEVGITTGDITEDPQARVVVATLETQKGRFLAGEGPALLVVDEYQMIADPKRGINYELVLAMAPPNTRLLLMSGSVGNPEAVADWLRHLGRPVTLVRHQQRPVPLEEIHTEALPGRSPRLSRQPIIRAVQQALMADLGPLLIFVPQRRGAEELARQLGRELPNPEPLELSPEQRAVAGPHLTSLLQSRIAFHHSGLDYQQRGGLIEPLAKRGQLRVVVATLGLASGVNFSMRSVLVTHLEYRSGEAHLQVRPDELLQMFGRAGRRGLDQVGVVLTLPDGPRLAEANPIQLGREPLIDWPAFLSVMAAAHEKGDDPIRASRTLRERLFRPGEIELGWNRLSPRDFESAANPSGQIRRKREFLNSGGEWERLRPFQPTPLRDCLIHRKGSWEPASQHAEPLRPAGEGRPCLLSKQSPRLYGKEIPLATWSEREEKGDLALSKWLRYQLGQSDSPELQSLSRRRFCSLEEWESSIRPSLPKLLPLGEIHALVDRGKQVCLLVNHLNTPIPARIDRYRKALINPPLRETEVVEEGSFGELAGFTQPPSKSSFPVNAWARLGLIKPDGTPTRRGILFSSFHHGDGLAIAAALESNSYDPSELLLDLANLRAGHRFSPHEGPSARLGATCRLSYGTAHFPGYLERGLPLGYGEGAAEVVQVMLEHPSRLHSFLESDLRTGDVERALIEWKSLLLQVAHAPAVPWDPWLAFQSLVQDFLHSRQWSSSAQHPPPPLTYSQRKPASHLLKSSDFR